MLVLQGLISDLKSENSRLSEKVTALEVQVIQKQTADESSRVLLKQTQTLLEEEKKVSQHFKSLLATLKEKAQEDLIKGSTVMKIF